MLNKKLKKLIRDPNLFFSDMVLKQKKKYGHIYTKKVAGHYQYTVVSAVYNVGRYLDDYFKSLVNQRLDFKKHIQLVLVDDGSTDNSVDIIKNWQKKYPNNISYIWKENGGQSSARNLGLRNVNTKWVTFMDPDDMLDADYFYNVDIFLYDNKDKDYNLLGCNVIFYMESSRTYKATHPLKYKFEKGNSSYALEKVGNNIQLSASTAFFRVDYIKINNVYFDQRVKPAFEDGKFISDYLLDVPPGFVAFLGGSKYFYRKRDDGTSTLDTAWTKVERFTDVPKYGHLDILNKYKKRLGSVPLFIQRTILYDVFWNLKWLLNNPERLSFLNSEQKEEYFCNMIKVFEFIDAKTIIDFQLAGCWFYHKMGMLSLFKNISPEYQIVYINNYDKNKKLVELRYFTNKSNYQSFECEGVEVYPIYEKSVVHDFINHVFIIERRVWLCIEDIEFLNIRIDNLPTKLSIGKKQLKSPIKIKDIEKYFTTMAPNFPKEIKFINSWLLMDRDIQADDNAEHLYRYIMEHHPETNIYFILRKSSHDWLRLKNDGFNLIEFGSDEHEKALKSCSKVISSHADKYVTNYLGPKMLAGRHYIFLQHGVIKDDLSGWLNQKEYIDCFITTTPYEYHSIVDNNTRYVYGEKEVALTGLPRHDSLLYNDIPKEKMILIMPTWRKSIVGNVVSEDGNKRSLNPDFMASQFASCWYSLLHSARFREIAEKYNYNVVFFPHANIQPYLEQFHVPEYIEVMTHYKGSIQNLFKRASLMITDYSSVAFDMAIQNKQTIYYQFDEDECFSGGHIYSKGYFNYRTDGFGPVVNLEDELLSSLNKLLQNDGMPESDILERISKTFIYRDGKNCERVYQAIKMLDNPLSKGHLNVELMKKNAQQASSHFEWPSAEVRWKEYLKSEENPSVEDKLYLVTALRKTRKFSEALQMISTIDKKDDLYQQQIILERAFLNMALLRWDEAVLDWGMIKRNSFDNIYYCMSLVFSKAAMPIDLEKIDNNDFFDLFNLFKLQRWQELINLWSIKKLKVLTIDIDYPRHVVLLLAHAYRLLNKPKLAHECLALFETVDKNDIHCRYEIARLAFYNKNWKKVLSQLFVSDDEFYFLPNEFKYYVIFSLKEIGDYDSTETLSAIFEKSIMNISSNDDDKYFFALTLMSLERWHQAAIIFSEMNPDEPVYIYNLALSLRYCGDAEKAYRAIKKNGINMIAEGWSLRAELAQLNNDWGDAYDSWRHYLSMSPSSMLQENIDRLQKLRLLSNSFDSKKIMQEYMF